MNEFAELIKDIFEKPEKTEIAPGQVKLKTKYETEKAAKELYELVINHIKQSEQLRIEINKETDIKVICDKALKCISLMTGDKAFYEINKKKLEQA